MSLTNLPASTSKTAGFANEWPKRYENYRTASQSYWAYTLYKHWAKSDRFEYGSDKIKRLAPFEKLTKLHLTGQFLKGDWLHYICSLTNLSDLKIDNLSRDTHIFETEYKNLSNLRKLAKLVISSKLAIQNPVSMGRQFGWLQTYKNSLSSIWVAIRPNTHELEMLVANISRKEQN